MINKLIKAENKIRELENKILHLEEINHKLKKTNHLKNEFVSLATHQIRGPLGAIKGYISLILEGDYGNVPEKFIEPLNIIFNSTDSLNKTVNDFLDVSRIEQGEMKYYMKDFNVVDLVNEVVREMKNSIKNNNLELRLNINADPIIVHDDKIKMKQIFTNLIDNANKYTEKGWVEISLYKKNEQRVIFCVKDSGLGIAKKTLPLLFRKFSRAKEMGHSGILGTGLGLYVAKKMMQAQHGQIWAESKGVGKGSEFYVEVPCL